MTPYAFTHASHKHPTTVSPLPLPFKLLSEITEDLPSWLKRYAHFSAAMKSNDRPNSFIFQGCLNQSESEVALVVKILIVKVIQAGSIVQEVIAMGVMTSIIVERWLPICIVSRGSTF